MKNKKINDLVKTHDISINNLINLTNELKQLNQTDPVVKTINDGCGFLEQQHLLKIQNELTKIMDSLNLLETTINNY